jgi:hypothetical protein
MRKSDKQKKIMIRRKWKWRETEQNYDKGGNEREEKRKKIVIRRKWKWRETEENYDKGGNEREEKQKKIMIKEEWKGSETEENVNAIFYIACTFVRCRTAYAPESGLRKGCRSLKRLLNTEREEPFGLTPFKKERKKERKKYTQYPT